MTPDLKTMLILCPLIFLAGFVDSVAGGGGLISLPAYLLAGLPIHTAYGTNKLSATCGTAVSVWRYRKGGYIRLRPALTAAAGALGGSWLGAGLVTVLDEGALQICLMAVLPAAAVFLLCNRGFGDREEDGEVPEPRRTLLSLAIGFVIGAYDGFFGPGTGTFLALAFTGLLHFSLTSATGTAKVVNLTSNLAALAVYILDGRVWYAVGLPAAVCGILGNYLGAGLAVKKGARFIRPVLVCAVALLLVKVGWDFFRG